MRISVVLSTYNRPRDLERVLWGYAVQTDRAFQLVVADDGSGAETAALVDRMRGEANLDLLHVWHEDRGFRKTEILNRAIAAAAGDYLVFSDGDCIPRRDLVATHRALAAPGRFIAGGYLKLPAAVSDRITVDDVTSGRVSDLAWLRAQGWRPGRRALRLTGSRRIGRIFDALTPTSTEFHGNNASVWREALERVNGFEGEMGYGGLDKALGYRLRNAGVRGVQARHRAVCLHLHHERPYRDPQMLRRNRELLARLRAGGEHRARRGLAELAPDPTLRLNGEPAYQESV
ncbi:glycosyltransferase [Longimicrobium sp.]|uniref:glycosyltransferase n=1 Tax=Longimicrobium sp. TaxID=2029185 RepID=UPI002C0A2424|nr:glycosyltransferase [Longimicrobium sp.]HSU15897.1 glycosyltransferase [Longimicrobium sp.]